MNSENFGKMISKLRKKAGLTQAELASRLNVTDKAISKWENGGAEPGIENLKALANLYGVTVDELVGRTDLYGGSMTTTFQSLRKLAELEGNYTVLPGHMEPTDLDTERATNYYMTMAMRG